VNGGEEKSGALYRDGGEVYSSEPEKTKLKIGVDRFKGKGGGAVGKPLFVPFICKRGRKKSGGKACTHWVRSPRKGKQISQDIL